MLKGIDNMCEQTASFSKDQKYVCFKKLNGNNPNEKCNIRERKWNTAKKTIIMLKH